MYHYSMRGTAYIHVILVKHEYTLCAIPLPVCTVCAIPLHVCSKPLHVCIVCSIPLRTSSRVNCTAKTLYCKSAAKGNLLYCKRCSQVQRGVIVCGIAHTVYTCIQHVRAYNIYAHTIYTRIYMYYYCMRDTAYIHVILSKTSIYCMRNLPYARYRQGRNID